MHASVHLKFLSTFLESHCNDCFVYWQMWVSLFVFLLLTGIFVALFVTNCDSLVLYPNVSFWVILCIMRETSSQLHVENWTELNAAAEQSSQLFWALEDSNVKQKPLFLHQFIHLLTLKDCILPYFPCWVCSISVADYGEDADHTLQNCILCILSNKEAVKTSWSCQDLFYCIFRIKPFTHLCWVLWDRAFVHHFSYFIISAADVRTHVVHLQICMEVGNHRAAMGGNLLLCQWNCGFLVTFC